MKFRFIFVPLLIVVCILLPMCEEEDVIDPEKVDVWTNYTTRNGIIDNEIWSITEDLYGNIWVGTGSGLCRFDGNKWDQVGQEAYVEGYPIYAVAMDGDGILWAGSGYGLDILVQGNWYWIDSLFGYPFTARSLYRDKNGDMWIGTYGSESIPGGLLAYDGEYFYEFTEPFKQPGFNNIYCITGDQVGNIWVGTDAGAVKLTPSGYEVLNSTNDLTFDDVTAILLDGWQDIWFGTFSGSQVGRLHGNQMEFLSLFHGYSISGVWTMTEDSHHNIWFGTALGVIKYNGVTMDATVKDELTGTVISCSLTDQKGKVWFGTLEKGLFVYTPK
jgi:ligand-binding sensor domain-containing protein